MNIWWKHDMKTWFFHMKTWFFHMKTWFSYSKISSHHPLIFPFSRCFCVGQSHFFTATVSRSGPLAWKMAFKSRLFIRFSHKCCSVLWMIYEYIMNIYDIPKIWNLNSWFRMFIGWFLLFTKFNYVKKNASNAFFGETCNFSNVASLCHPATNHDGREILQEIWSQPKSREPKLNPSWESWESLAGRKLHPWRLTAGTWPIYNDLFPPGTVTPNGEK